MKKKLSEMTLEELWQLFPILLRPYNPAYPEWFAAERAELETLPGGMVRRIRHIGSTAVPGLTAKPTVDILLEIDRSAGLPELRAELSARGWTVMHGEPPPDFRLDLCKGYTEEGFAERVHHLHVRYSGDWDEPYFCEYLRRHPDAAEEYARLKTRLAVSFKHDRDAYTEAKGDFIRRCIAAARREFPGRFRP